jgi:hypothetical protein
MTSTSTKSTAPRRRLGQVAGVTTMTSALAVAILMAVSPATAGPVFVNLFHGVTPIKLASYDATGCSKNIPGRPTFSTKTLDGSAVLSSYAVSCSLAKGGVNMASDASTIIELGLSSVAKARAGTTTVNVSFGVQANVSDSALGSAKHCPLTTTSTSLNVPNGTQYTNLTRGECLSEADYVFEATVEVCEITPAGASNCSFGSYFLDNETGFLDYIVVQQVNYSSPLAGTNSTYNYSESESFGVRNTSVLHGTYSVPVIGTWSAGSRLLITSIVFLRTDAETWGKVHCTATGSIDAGTGTNHVDVLGMTVR